MGKYAWKNQSLGVKVFFVGSMAFTSIMLGSLYMEDYLEAKEWERQRLAAEAEWLETETDSSIYEEVVTTNEEPEKREGYVYEDDVRNGQSFILSGVGGEETNLAGVDWDMALRDANRYAHVPVSGRYTIECVSVVPREWETENDELKGDFKVWVSSMGSVRNDRTAAWGRTGWIGLSVGEKREIAIDKLDQLHMTDGSTFELTLIEAQE